MIIIRIPRLLNAVDPDSPFLDIDQGYSPPFLSFDYPHITTVLGTVDWFFFVFPFLLSSFVVSFFFFFFFFFRIYFFLVVLLMFVFFSIFFSFFGDYGLVFFIAINRYDDNGGRSVVWSHIALCSIQQNSKGFREQHGLFVRDLFQ